MKLVIDIPENLYLFVCENGILAMDILNSEERDVLAEAIQTGEVDLWKIRQEATENALKKAEVLYSDTYSKDECEGEYLRGFTDCAKLNVERPQGEWQPDRDSFYCDQCGVTALEINRKWYKSNFCPNCGAKMGNAKTS